MDLDRLLAHFKEGVEMVSKKISDAPFSSLEGEAGRTNVQGERVQKLDEIANDIFISHFKDNQDILCIVTEEEENPIITSRDDRKEGLVIACDPLDGSSNLGINVPVGSIIGVYKVKDFDPSDPLKFFDPNSLVLSAFSIYGALTSIIYTCSNEVVEENFHGGVFKRVKRQWDVNKESGPYSVNEGYSSLWDEQTFMYVKMLKDTKLNNGKERSLRYIGSLVADVYRTLRKGGVFLYPHDNKHPHGKLRLLYECFPIAHIVETCGGSAWGRYGRILDLRVKEYHQRSPIFVGASKLVRMWSNLVLEEGSCGGQVVEC